MSLHLVRMPVDGQRLYGFARRSRLPARDFDDGYAVHALLTALFDHGAAEGERVAPKPFALAEPSGRMLDVLGYARLDHRALADRAKSFADPLAWGAIDLEAMVSRAMPESFAAGTRLGFDTRVCPVRRVAKRGHQRADRAEVDAFLARAWELGESVKLDREIIYREWLAAELTKVGALLEVGTMQSYRLGRQHRRTQGAEREGRRVSHPEVVFSGVLRVSDSAAFQAGLARGLGRHRAFGFGMILLKPAKGAA